MCLFFLLLLQLSVLLLFFVFKQKTAYEMRISDWSSDVCSSDLPLFRAWGNTGVEQARRIVDISLDAGVNFFDTADVYSDGASESILGAAIKGRRDRVIVSTKTSLRMGDGPNDVGSSHQHLVAAVDKALPRPGTAPHDLLPLHHYDATPPVGGPPAPPPP